MSLDEAGLAGRKTLSLFFELIPSFASFVVLSFFCLSVFMGFFPSCFLSFSFVFLSSTYLSVTVYLFADLPNLSIYLFI